MKAEAKGKGDAPAAPAAPAGSKKKMIIMLAAAVLLAGGGGRRIIKKKTKDGHAAAEHKAEKAEPPEYLQVEPFTVNLLPEGEPQYLQIGMTLQVQGPKEAETIKANMAKVRNRILLILSARRHPRLPPSRARPSWPRKSWPPPANLSWPRASRKRWTTSCSPPSSSSSNVAKRGLTFHGRQFPFTGRS